LAPFLPGTFGTLFGWLTFVVLNRYLTVPEWWALIALGFVNLFPAPVAGLLERRIAGRRVVQGGPILQAALALIITH
ncbi:hypothetical protein SB778_46960, partial [Paraburkholderia sp. SIMBA_050]